MGDQEIEAIRNARMKQMQQQYVGKLMSISIGSNFYASFINILGS